MAGAEQDLELLDPPNELIDTPCTAGDLITTSRTPSMFPSSRAGSIGTLTSWQLLARQVGNQGDDEEEAPLPTPTKPSAVSADLLCSPRSSSWTSGAPNIAPRPHQTLYKEYRLLETIGKGAFGTVSIAIRRSDGKQLVAKEIALGQASLASAKQREAIMGEVNVLARMKHPNIVKYCDCFMDPNYLIIIMEFCSAGDLSGVLKKQAGQLLPEKHIMFLFVQILLAMHHVHGAGVLHRDLKTSNILATRPSTRATTPGSATPTAGAPKSSSPADVYAAGEFGGLPLLKLADFGVAKAGCDTDGSMVGTTVGTPHYLSPEMCDGKRYGKKTDVWALGCILYEIACQRKAFEASNIGGIYRKIAAAEYDPLPDCYSSGLKGLVRSMLAKETKERPSVSEVLNTPYVRQHLGAYLAWARNIPDAQPEVLLASISQSADGATTPRSSASRTGSQRLPASPPSSSRTVSGAQVDSSAQPSQESNQRSAPNKPPPLVLQKSNAATLSTADGAAHSGLAPANPVTQQQQHTALLSQPEQSSAHTKAHTAFMNSRPPSTSTASAVFGPGQPDLASISVPMAALATAANSMPGVQDATSTASTGASAAAQKPPSTSKPNPFYAAAAAIGANLGINLPFKASPSHAETAAVQLKKKLPVGGGSCSLDIWASANEPSSELIAAFHNMGSLECSTSSGIRRVSSAHGSPKSPLGQHMHSWTQDEDQQWCAVQEQGNSEVHSYRSTNESGVQCLPTVPLPWLATDPGAAPGVPSKHGSCSENWLATLVQSLEFLKQSAPAPTPAAASTAAPAFRAWDPSMAAINKGDLVDAGLVPAASSSMRTTNEQPPSSLQGWLSGDGNLLQALHASADRRNRTRSASYSGSLPRLLSPLGGATSRASRSPGTTFIAPAAAPASMGYIIAQQTLSQSDNWFSNLVHESGAAAVPECDQQPAAQSGASSAGQPGGSSPAAANSSARVPNPVVAQVLPVSTTSSSATAAQAAEATEIRPSHQMAARERVADLKAQSKKPTTYEPCVSVLAAADSSGDVQDSEDSDVEDDLPLAVMVKQCLSGQSFMYNSNPSTAMQSSDNVQGAAVSSGSNAGHGSRSGQSASSSEAHAMRDSGQLADQEDARMLEEQQDVVRRFNTFRAILGIKPGKYGVMVQL